MNRFQRRVALRVLAIHGGVILFLLLFSGLKGCFQPKPKKEIVTFVDFGSPAPPVAMQEVEQMQEPEPPAPDPAPTPEPVKPAPTPEPPKKTISKPKPKTETPKPKPKKPEKPKPKLVKAEDIKLGRKVEPTKPVKPAVSSSDISKSLSNVQSKDALPSAGAVGNPDTDAAYIAQIGRFFDSKWNEPGNASPTSSVVYRIYISQWGTITKRTKVQGSGDSSFDASVSAAVHSVSSVSKPPAGFSLGYVEIEFRIRN